MSNAIYIRIPPKSITIHHQFYCRECKTVYNLTGKEMESIILEFGNLICLKLGCTTKAQSLRYVSSHFEDYSDIPVSFKDFWECVYCKIYKKVGPEAYNKTSTELCPSCNYYMVYRFSAAEISLDPKKREDLNGIDLNSLDLDKTDD